MDTSTTSAKKVAIVTGSSRGIGAAIAERLAKENYAVAVTYTIDRSSADEVLGKIRAAQGTAEAFQADVSSAADVKRLFDEVGSSFGGVDAVVNNAGILINKTIAEAVDEDFDQTYAVNVKGVFMVLREAAKHLRDEGRIVNLSSSVLALNLPTYGIYASSKAAVEIFTRVLAQELRGRKITVNAIAPGPVATELFLKGKTADLVRHYEQMNPLERLGLPHDIASVVSFLLGPDGGWVNGQVLRANGGMV